MKTTDSYLLLPQNGANILKLVRVSILLKHRQVSIKEKQFGGMSLRQLLGTCKLYRNNREIGQKSGMPNMTPRGCVVIGFMLTSMLC